MPYNVLGGYNSLSGSGDKYSSWIRSSNNLVEFIMKKNISGQNVSAELIARSDGTDFTGTVSVFITIDGGDQFAGLGVVTPKGNGSFGYKPTQAETNGDYIEFTFTGLGAVSSGRGVYTSFPQTVDNNVLLSSIDSDYSKFNPAVDVVANVTLVDTTTTNTDMVGTNNALLASDYTAPDNAGITQIQDDIATLNNISVADVFTTQMTESYATNGIAPTLAQALFISMQSLQDFSYSGGAQTVRKIDGVSVAATYTLNNETAPTAKTRSS